MKIYISGSITSDPNYKQKFAAVELKLIKNDHKVMNPAILPPGFDYEEYMKICFAMVDVCDAIYMIPGWDKSPGAIREKEYAELYRKLVLFDTGGPK